MLLFIKRLKLKISDMKTIKLLCEGAEKHAHSMGEELPGAEHFLISALELPDGTAKNVFQRLGKQPNDITEALKQQYIDALNSVAIDTSITRNNDDYSELIQASHLFYAKPSAQSLMKALALLRKNDKDTPLLGLHIVDVLSTKLLGTVGRTLKALKLDEVTLKNAIQAEINTFKSA